jgi:hypothetical protein
MTTAPPDQERATRRRLRLALLVSVVIVVLTTVAAGGYAVGSSQQGRQQLADRQAEIAELGESVMPFELDATTHVFAERRDGGIQTVTADDPTDAEQVALVRAHLLEEAEAFTRGDFGDPATIHGDEMPGLAELRAHDGRLQIEYAEVAGGARITYRSQDLALVDALHAWFRAQVSDHGEHAEDETS